MALSKSITPEEILDEIGEDFLTCPVCLEQYKNPKFLPCHHTFCQQCLENIVEKTGTLKHCPSCQTSIQLPKGGVSRLDNNFFMNSMLEAVKKRIREVTDHNERKRKKFHKKTKQAAMHDVLTSEKQKTRKQPSTVRAKESCTSHPEYEMKYYCNTCRIPICSECTIIDHRIPDHSHRHLHEVADECNKELSVLVEKSKVKAREVDQTKAVVKDACKKVTEQCMVNKQKVRKQKDALIDQLEKEEKWLVKRLDSNCRLQVKGLERDISDLELKYEDLIITGGYTETLIHQGNPAHLVLKHQSIVDKLEELVAMETKPNTEHEVVEFFPSDENISDMLGLLRSDICISQCTVDNIPKCLLKGESINLQITTKDRSDEPVIPRQAVEVTLTKPDGSKTNLDVTDNRDCTHTVTANTDMDGKYQVAMTIGDQEVSGSPFEIPVIKGLLKTLGKEGNNKGEFHEPGCLAINRKGDLVVTDKLNNRIQIIDGDGNCKKTFEFKEFKKTFCPIDVAVLIDDRYFMTDKENKQVVVSDEDGKVITTFGQNELKHPRGISISPLDGTVYVSDWDGNLRDKTDKKGHSIRKYTKDGVNHIKSFGKYGKENGEFRGPWKIVHDSQGMLFVSDYENHRIQVFNADDQFLYKFGTKGNQDGQLFRPMGLCLDSDRYVYISDHNHRVQKFDISGRFISRVDRKEDGLNVPAGLVLTKGVPSKVAVADNKNHCIRVYVH